MDLRELPILKEQAMVDTSEKKVGEEAPVLEFRTGFIAN
jgi:hypothetical protein